MAEQLTSSCDDVLSCPHRHILVCTPLFDVEGSQDLVRTVQMLMYQILQYPSLYWYQPPIPFSYLALACLRRSALAPPSLVAAGSDRPAQSIFIGPLPGLLLILLRPSAVLFYNVCFAIPSILFSIYVVPFWASQPQDLSCQRVRIVQRYFSRLLARGDSLSLFSRE